MRATTRLEDSDRAFKLRISPQKLQQYDVVRDVGDPELGQACGSEQRYSPPRPAGTERDLRS